MRGGQIGYSTKLGLETTSSASTTGVCSKTGRAKEKVDERKRSVAGLRRWACVFGAVD